jgi:PAS domain S-box-containing protein
MIRVLVVDDKMDNIYYLHALLGAHGCGVDSARHGAEALLKARQTPPDLVISDLLMPVMDGYTLLRHWKADARLKSVPFIVYTATYTEPEDERLALHLGADAFILKPCEPDAFLERVKQVEINARTSAPAPTSEPVLDETLLLREYSEALVHKLEDKSLQLERSNRALQSDIAVREKVEAALRESEERFRQLAESIEDVMWLRRPDIDVFIYVSPAYEAVWGRSRASLYASSSDWLVAVHPDDRERVWTSLPRQELGPWEEMFRIVRPDGSLRWIRSRAYPVRDASGRVYRIAGVSRDITEQRRLEAQFLQAQKMEAVGRLAGGVAHDFNNLLSVILGYTSFVLEQLPSDASCRDSLQEVWRAGERATDLTRQLLAFSRHQVLEPRVLKLSQVVGQMEGMLRRILGEDIELSLLMSLTPGKVYADPSQVEQIVMNLAVNARDAMPHGGKLSIEVANVELAEDEMRERGGASGAHVLLAVSDTGSGMDAATRARIFEPFFTTKEKGKGTGLGLSTVYGIVKQSNGHIAVSGEPGHGTRFEVYLPRTDRALESEAPPPPAPLTLHGSETILLAEDDAQVRVMTRALLERYGYRVLAAQNGADAVLLSEQHEGTIQLLLTDVVMPRMSGRELAERLAPARPTMHVLYMSGYTEDSVVYGAIFDSGVPFLRKPFTPDALLRKVRAVLNAVRGEREAKA